MVLPLTMFRILAIKNVRLYCTYFETIGKIGNMKCQAKNGILLFFFFYSPSSKFPPLQVNQKQILAPCHSQKSQCMAHSGKTFSYSVESHQMASVLHLQLCLKQVQTQELTLLDILDFRCDCDGILSQHKMFIFSSRTAD